MTRSRTPEMWALKEKLTSVSLDMIHILNNSHNIPPKEFKNRVVSAWFNIKKINNEIRKDQELSDKLLCEKCKIARIYGEQYDK